ncbi:MAG: HAD family hydrolase [Bacteroidota bacterium]
MPSSLLATLDSFLSGSPTDRSHQKPIAVFDCDGTLIQGDIGEAMFFRQIEEFQFRTSPANLWLDHPKRDEIDNLYESLAAIPHPKRKIDRRFNPFCQILLNRYFDQLANGDIEKACADIVRLLAGFSLREVGVLARATLRAELEAPPGKRQIGKTSLPLGIRYIQDTLDAIEHLKNRGFDLWAISGSNQWAVETVFERAGIPRERILGIELKIDGDILTSEIRKPIPILDGKIEAMKARTNQVPLMVFSDSPIDLPLFRYASGMKVLINSRTRTSAEFFSTAGVKKDKSWIVVEQPTLVTNE